jgi:UDP-N-acetyl-D-mannosaminuronic acid dehydrogenase
MDITTTKAHMKLPSSQLLAQLKVKIEAKEAVIGVVGLGYVGLPVACSFARSGFDVVGIDIKADRINTINEGKNPIAGEEPGLSELLAGVVAERKLRASTDYNDLANADIILVDVETPVDENHKPLYVALRSVCKMLGPVVKHGALLIIESTIAPGTIDTIVLPLLEESSGGQVNQAFFLGACPERVMPGKLLSNLRNMSRVCGGNTPETAEVMVALYRHIVNADLDIADPVTAELVKTTENAYRDVQIAFANEVALICEVVGADVWRVRELVNKSPGRNMLFPGAGVGGHCIPKDPWLLMHGAQGQAPVRLIPSARAVNESMPSHMVKLTLDALQEANVSISDARILVMGYSYLENSDDTRNSPSIQFIDEATSLVAKVLIHDPWVHEYTGDLLSLASNCDALVVMVAHDEYRTLNLASLKKVLKTPVIVDGRQVFEKDQVLSENFIYSVIGQGIVR